MIDFLIKSYQKYTNLKFLVYRKISNYCYKKAYSQIYRCDDFSIQYFRKKMQTGINQIIENHLKDSESMILDKLEDYIEEKIF